MRNYNRPKKPLMNLDKDEKEGKRRKNISPTMYFMKIKNLVIHKVFFFFFFLPPIQVTIEKVSDGTNFSIGTPFLLEHKHSIHRFKKTNIVE